MSRVFLTGSTGFVGAAVLRALCGEGHDVVAPRRGNAQPPAGAVAAPVIASLETADWGPLLSGCDAVIHCAGLAAAPGKDAGPLLRAVNAEGTRRLAEAAAAAGVRRFVHVSSIKVLTADAGDVYARSKRASEDALKAVAAEMEVVILRPPPVIGAGARGAFATLLRLARSGLPLPFGALKARRSLIAAESLGRAAVAGLAAPPGAYGVSDGALSVAETVRFLREGFDMPPRLAAVPPRLIGALLKALNRRRLYEQMLEPLACDAGPFEAATGWRPAPLEETLREIARSARQAQDASA